VVDQSHELDFGADVGQCQIIVTNI